MRVVTFTEAMKLITDRLRLAPPRGKRGAMTRQLRDAITLVCAMLNVVRDEAGPSDDGAAPDDSKRPAWEVDSDECPMCGELRDAARTGGKSMTHIRGIRESLFRSTKRNGRVLMGLILGSK